MSKSLLRIIYLVSLLLEAVGAFLTVSGIQQGTGSSLLLIGVPMVVVAGTLLLIIWISALVQTVQLRRWAWFVSLLIFTALALLLYVFIDPQQSPVA